jgi:DNA-binding transcriptional ArsR family regulator
MSRWGLLSNHALVLLHVAEHPRSTLREIAAAVGVTDRAALSLLRAIEEDGIVARRREGRQNVYNVNLEALLAHRSYGRFTISQVAALLLTLSGLDAQTEMPEGFAAGAAGVTGGAAPRQTTVT